MKSKYEELTFADDFMFCKILQNNEDLCRELLELILGRKVRPVRNTETQKTIEITADAKGVRFDVYLDDDDEHIYDIEMQTTLQKNLPKRMRYYQGMIDLNLIERGADYEALKKTYIIFICLENPYPEHGLHKYTFDQVCREDNALKLGDETAKIILSAEGSKDDVSEELKDFLNYLATQRANTPFTKKLDAKVKDARQHKRWRGEYMTLYEKYQEFRKEGIAEGRAEGIAEGRAEGLAEGEVRTLLKQICAKLKRGQSSEEIAEALEQNISVVTEFIDAAQPYAPEYNIDDIYAKLQKNE